MGLKTRVFSDAEVMQDLSEHGGDGIKQRKVVLGL